jgi:hypothetical protein
MNGRLAMSLTIAEEVQRRVEERKQAEHPPQPQQPSPAGRPAQRGDRERDAQEVQRPGAERADDELDRVRSESVGGRKPHEPRHRQQRQREQRGAHACEGVRRQCRRNARQPRRSSRAGHRPHQ